MDFLVLNSHSDIGPLGKSFNDFKYQHPFKTTCCNYIFGWLELVMIGKNSREEREWAWLSL